MQDEINPLLHKLDDLRERTQSIRGSLFSGWKEVTSEGAVNINFLFETPLHSPMSVVVMSRAVTGSVDFSWLKFSDLRVARQFDGTA